MSGRIFVAGASGAIGRRLVPLLLAEGWEVTGMTRSPAKADALRAGGIAAAVADAFDADSVTSALVAARPEVVMHQLTDLPPERGAIDAAALERNARLRETGTANLVRAAREAGARKLVAQSISFAYAPGPLPHREGDALKGVIEGEPKRGMASLEEQVGDSGLAGIVLRYGHLYGPGTWDLARSSTGSVHVDAAAHAARLAARSHATGIFNVAEDDGEVDSARARDILGWDPDFRLSA